MATDIFIAISNWFVNYLSYTYPKSIYCFKFTFLEKYINRQVCVV